MTVCPDLRERELKNGISPGLQELLIQTTDVVAHLVGLARGVESAIRVGWYVALRVADPGRSPGLMGGAASWGGAESCTIFFLDWLLQPLCCGVVR